MLGISISLDRRTLEIRNQALSKAPLPPPQYGPDLRYEELLTITVGHAETPKAVRPVSARLSQLAERFAVISSTEAAAAAVSSMKDHAGQPPPQDKFIMSCRFSREPMFLDSKGKRVPQPVQRKVVMRKVEFPVDILDHTDGKVTIRDIELVLGQCFSLKASMIPQA